MQIMRTLWYQILTRIYNQYQSIQAMQGKSTLSKRLCDSISKQFIKYKQMGYGKYFALFTFSLYFTVELDILKIIWPSIHGIMPDKFLYVATITILNFLIMTSYNCAMYFIYKHKIPFFEQYRANKDAPWPWESKPKQWNSLLLKTIRVNMLNILFYGPLLALAEALIEFNIKMDMQSVPEVKTIIWQFPIFLITEQIVFYAIHRIMHHPKFYWIHKDHHEYNVTIVLANQYAHPIEHLLANNIPAGLGYVFLAKVYPVHVFTVVIWLTFRLFQTCDGHSGYNWPWGQSQLFPFSAGGSYHYFHHKQNVGNYSAILHIVDTVFNTNQDYYKFDAQKRTKKND